MSKISLTINDKTVEVPKGTTVLEAAEKANVDIPTLCHDPRLEPFAACRLCFVEIEGGNKPMAACATEAGDGMVVTTNSETLSGIRKTALELLLSTHYGDCMGPCNIACPSSVDVQGFIAHIANGKPRAAAQLVRETMPFPSSVGRVCPRFCEEKCRRDILEDPVSICTLHRYAGDQDLNAGNESLPEIPADSGKSVAVIGGGPAGLTAAFFLRQKGHKVTIYEREEKLGGMLRYGIPEYRLPNDLLDREIDFLLQTGIEVKTGQELGKDFTVDGLKENGYDAVFMGIGAQENKAMDLGCSPDLTGYYSGIDFLKDVVEGREVPIGNKVIVVGGGNTAMDASRTALRLGAEVTVVYRRAREQMPADPKEVEEAIEEGVNFEFLTNPKQVLGEEKVSGIECIRMELGEPDESGRRRPVPIKGSEFEMEADSIILAVGQEVDEACISEVVCQDLCASEWGTVEVDEGTKVTTSEGVFAGGDCVMGPSTVVESIGQAKDAVVSIDRYLNGEALVALKEEYNCSRGENDEIDPSEYDDIEAKDRTAQPTIAPEERKHNFVEFEKGLDELSAYRESKRCLSCGCDEVFDCKLKDLATEYDVSDEEIIKLDREQKHPIPEDHPYIKRDPNKCVLCGSCVRICAEVLGVHAFGMVNRGLDTIVKPSLEMPLEETNCVSCSQCISACPTGALTVRVDLEKPGPWKTKEVESVCPHCSVGCSLNLKYSQGELIRVSSPIKNEVNYGNLCVEGAFQYNTPQEGEKVDGFQVRNNGTWESAKREEALEFAADKLKSAKEKGELAVLISPKLSMEIASTASDFASSIQAGYIAAAEPVNYQVLKNASSELFEKETSKFADIDQADMVMIYRSNLGAKYPVMEDRIRMRYNRGAKVAVIGEEPTKLDDFAKINLEISGVEDGVNVLENIKNEQRKTGKIGKLSAAFKDSNAPVILADGGKLTVEELNQLKELHQKDDGVKVIILQPAGNNYAVVAHELVNNEFEEVKEKVRSGEIKGVITIESDEKVEFENTNAGEPFVAKLLAGRKVPGNSANVVLTGEDYLGMEGSFYNSEGRMQKMNPVIAPENTIEQLLQSLEERL